MGEQQLAHCGPGYKSPLDAFKNGKREKLLYINGPSSDPSKPDVLFTVDVDPNSKTYQQIIHILEMPYIGDELHHSGWNVCSSCHNDCSKKRRYLILPGVRSGRIYAVDTIEERNPKIHKIIQPQEFTKYGLTHPHSLHCLPSNEIMISTMGDKYGNAKGGFMIIDENFNVKGRWTPNEEDKHLNYGYDFWYQPYHDICVSSEWAAPNSFNKGFIPEDIAKYYGRSLNFWNWKDRTLKKKIDLGTDGLVPLEVRFLHNPKSEHGFVGTALGSCIFHFFKDEKTNEWNAERRIQVDPIDVENWVLPSMPGLLSDILISMDDKFLYFSNWLHGDIRQYDISDPFNPKLTGQLFLGGSIKKGTPVKVKSTGEQTDVTTLKGKPVEAGPQMLQLSLDGKRLYVTTSLYTTWDKQFYPEMAKIGTSLLKIDIDTEKGGMKIDENFHVQFKDKNGNAYLAHEMRYPGGDCTSDIFLTN